MLIEIFAAASIGAIFGFGTCAALTAGKVADLEESAGKSPLILDVLGDGHLFRASVDDMLSQIRHFAAAHSRCADALTTMQSRIERALDCVTENSAHVGKKMAAILKGERL